MKNCWANILHDCNGGISREHIVSKSLFISSQIDVKGFSWCKEQSKLVCLANLTKKCLCKKHNSNLSPLDLAAAHAFATLRKQTRLLMKERGVHIRNIKKFHFLSTLLH